MDRSFEDICKDLIQIHNKEIQDLKEKRDSWKERFEKLRAQKQKCQEEYQVQRKENACLHKEVSNLLDSISRLHTRDVNQKCTACESLHKTLETLRESYNQSLQEKDRVIAFLDSRLSELSGGESFLSKLNLRYSTPKKCNDHNQDQGDRKVPSEKKQSPDSTIRITPVKEDEDGLVFSLSPERSGASQNKGTKLCLSRGQKRHRYTEKTLTDPKRRKVACEDTEKKRTSEKKHTEKVLVAETCNMSMGCENNSLEDKLSVTSFQLKNKNGNDENIGETDISNIQTIPETVNFFDACPSSSSDSEEESSYSQSTVKRAPNQSYSLRSVLCSPPSSDDDEVVTDMRNVVNHKTIHLSGQSILIDPEEQEIGQKSDRFNSDNKINLNANNHKTGDISFTVKPCEKAKRTATLQQYTGTGEQTEVLKKKLSEKEKTASQWSAKNSPENVCEEIQQVDSSPSPSPVFNSGIKNCPEMTSPSLFRNGKSEMQQVEEPESPLLLRIGNKVDDDVTIIDSPELRKSKGISFDEKQPRNLGSYDEESPLSSGPISNIKSKAQNLSKSSSSTAAAAKCQKKRVLRLSRGNKIELTSKEEATLSPRQLRQTTLSQVFNRSPVRERKKRGKKSDSQEEVDLQRAIQLSLRETEGLVKHQSSDTGQAHHDNDTKENTPPFKKPDLPIRKRSRHSSNESPLKGTKVSPQKSHNKRAERSPDQKSRRSLSKSVLDLDETLPPLINGNKNIDTISVNGSIDPAVELSLICEEDSEPLLQNDHKSLKKKSLFRRHGEKNESETSREGKINFDYEDNHVRSLGEMNDSIATLKDFRIEDLGQADKSPSRPPLTSTCIEEDSQSIPCSSRSVKFGSRKKKVVVSNDCHPENDVEGSEEKEMDHREIKTHDDIQSLDSSFDRVPEKSGAGYAYVDVVRKQSDRKNLVGYECKECYEYYEAMGLGEAEIRQRIQSGSRHRAHYVPPETPPHFWSVGFPDTQECEERGYLNKEEDMDEKDIRPAFRRRRKLKKMFKSKNETEDDEQEASDSEL